MKKQTASQIINILSNHFEDKPALNFTTPFELLIAVILSAQCTDERVNKVTAKLFRNYNKPQDFAVLSVEELGSMIYSCGFYKAKAEHIISASRDIVERFDGKVPDNVNDLMTLAGVGRKTANVVYSVAFKGDAIAVDTHVYRVSNRIGLANAKDVLATEKQLMQILSKDLWSKAHHYLIYLGRRVCKARKPLCKDCPIKDLCESNKK